MSSILIVLDFYPSADTIAEISAVFFSAYEVRNDLYLCSAVILTFSRSIFPSEPERMAFFSQGRPVGGRRAGGVFLAAGDFERG
jgi:hypothetical protein